MYTNYLKQTIAEYEFLNQVAEDIAKHKFSRNVIAYASKFVTIWLGNKTYQKMSQETRNKKIKEYQENPGSWLTLNYRDNFCYFYDGKPRFTDLFLCVADKLPDSEDDPDFKTLKNVLENMNPDEFQKECGEFFNPCQVPEYIPYIHILSKKDLQKTFPTNVRCPKCGNILHTTDVYRYAFTCHECCENFYRFELHKPDPKCLLYFVPMTEKAYSGYLEKLEDIKDVYECDILHFDVNSNRLTIGWNLSNGYPDSRILFETAKQIGRITEKGEE